MLRAGWHGPLWIQALVLLFWLFDQVRGALRLNLGRFPMWLKVLYLRVLGHQFGFPGSDGAPVAVWGRAERRRQYFRLSRRLRSAYYGALLGWRGIPAMAGGATIIGERHALIYQNNPGGLPVLLNPQAFSGNVWFVDAAAAATGTTAAYGHHPDAALSTIDSVYNSGVGQANQGDAAIVLPSHTETISGAGGITSDVAGIRVVGLGQGANRPTVTFSATGSTWAISAASTYVQNVRVTSSVNELVSMFNITAADVTLDGVDYIDPGAAKETLQFVLTTSGATRLCIRNCHHVATTAAAGAQKWIALVGVAQARIVDCTFMLKLFDHATSSVINMDSGVTVAELGRLRIHLTGYSAAMLSAVLAHASATGIHYDSRIYADVAAVTTINDFPGGASFEVYCSNDLDKNGILDPVVGS